MTICPRGIQRLQSAPVGDRDVGAGLDQNGERLKRAGLGGVMRRRKAGDIRQIEAGSPGDQQLDRRNPIVESSPVQCPPAVGIPPRVEGVDLRPAVERLSDGNGVA